MKNNIKEMGIKLEVNLTDDEILNINNEFKDIKEKLDEIDFLTNEENMYFPFEKEVILREDNPVPFEGSLDNAPLKVGREVKVSKVVS